jgi:hypothetical protein
MIYEKLLPLNNFIRGLSLPYRGDCPQCGHKNTFSASLLDGSVIYYCFYAGCKLKGKIDGKLSIDTIRNDSNRIYPSNEIVCQLPDYFISPLQNPQCLSFMKRWELLEKYGEGLELYYDPRQHRCVFPLRNFEKELYGTIGRSLHSSIQPRWLVYNRKNDCPYISSALGANNSICILVEDCISAIRVSPICDAMAMLGTNIPIGTYRYFRSYDKLFIALDDDATQKSIKLQKELSIIKATEIILLKKDLKYYNQEEIQELKRCLK